MLKPNKTKAKMRAGEAVFGFTIGVPYANPNLVEMLGSLGFDYVDVVCENDLFDETSIEDVIRAADVCGMTTILRTPYNPGLILHALNSGCQGVLVTRVGSKADVQAVLDAAKFHPEGKRTVFHGGRTGNFWRDVNAPEGSNPELINWTLAVNRETIVGCTIEEIGAVNELDDILALPGIDLIGIGPGDLAHSMGWPPQEEVDRLVEMTRVKSLAAGKTVFSPVSLETMPGAIEKGFRAFAFSPTSALESAANDYLTGGRSIARAKGVLGQ